MLLAAHILLASQLNRIGQPIFHARLADYRRFIYFSSRHARDLIILETERDDAAPAIKCSPPERCAPASFFTLDASRYGIFRTAHYIPMPFQ